MVGNSKLLSLSEAAEVLNVHPNTLRNWDAAGVLKALRIGPKALRKYSEEDVVKFLRASRSVKKVHVDRGPVIAVAVMVIGEKSGKILLGKRKAVRGRGEYAFPGGYLAFGETFEESAINEVLEETGLKIRDPKFICVTNNLKNLDQEGKQSVTIGMKAQYRGGEPKALEPEACEFWEWYPVDYLPDPMFEADGKIVEAYKKGLGYVR